MIREIIELSRSAEKHGFYRKGMTMFRLHGDGVLQILKLEKERLSKQWAISLGLQSVYMESLPRWFTSLGSIPRYFVHHIAGERNLINLKTTRFEHEMKILEEKGYSWLDGIITQETLAEAICFLDIVFSGSVICSDSMKFAPYLHSAQYDQAENVITSMLERNHYAEEVMQQWQWAKESDGGEYMERIHDDNMKLEKLLQMVRNRDLKEIQDYLKSNYTANMTHIRRK